MKTSFFHFCVEFHFIHGIFSAIASLLLLSNANTEVRNKKGETPQECGKNDRRMQKLFGDPKGISFEVQCCCNEILLILDILRRKLAGHVNFRVLFLGSCGELRISFLVEMFVSHHILCCCCYSFFVKAIGVVGVIALSSGNEKLSELHL